MNTKFHRLTPLFSQRSHFKSIGYARDITHKQISIDAQIQELTNAGCILVFQESDNSGKQKRPQFDAALKALKKGDEIVFTKLDRGFKNQRQCINTLYELQKKGIHVRTTDGVINTRALGKLAPIFIGLLSGLGEIERQMLIERTQESINHRKEQGGNLGGRPKTNNEKASLVLRLRNEGYSYRSIRKQTGLALSTIRRIIVDKEKIGT